MSREGPPPLTRHVELGAVLGSGGMGRVMAGTCRTSGRPVAVKLSFGRPDAGLQRRQAREVELLARVEHPRLARLLGAYTAEKGDLALVYEYVEGEDLGARVGRAPPSREEVVAWTRDLAAALGTLHAAGLVHRDVKPANVRVTSEGAAILLDFGLTRRESKGATLTASGTVLGTPLYLAPEILRGERPTAASDQYSLALTSYFLLTGAPAFAEHPAGLFEAHLHEPLPAPSRPGGAARSRVHGVLRRGAAKAPGERFEDVDRLAEALATALDGAELEVRGPAEPAGPTVVATRPSRAPGPAPRPDPPPLPRGRLLGRSLLVVPLALALGWIATRPAPEPGQEAPAAPSPPAPPAGLQPVNPPVAPGPRARAFAARLGSDAWLPLAVEGWTGRLVLELESIAWDRAVAARRVELGEPLPEPLDSYRHEARRFLLSTDLPALLAQAAEDPAGRGAVQAWLGGLISRTRRAIRLAAHALAVEPDRAEQVACLLLAHAGDLRDFFLSPLAATPVEELLGREPATAPEHLVAAVILDAQERARRRLPDTTPLKPELLIEAWRRAAAGPWRGPHGELPRDKARAAGLRAMREHGRYPEFAAEAGQLLANDGGLSDDGQLGVALEVLRCAHGPASCAEGVQSLLPVAREAAEAGLGKQLRPSIRAELSRLLAEGRSGQEP